MFPATSQNPSFDIQNDQSINTPTFQDMTQGDFAPISFEEEESQGDTSSITPSNLNHNAAISTISAMDREQLLCYLQALDSNSIDPELVDFIHSLAENDCVQAQSMLGIWYYEGVMVQENFKEAVKWNTRAASQGCKIAMYNLGWSYYLGEGVEQDKREGIRLFRESGRLGHTKGRTLANELGNNLEMPT